MIKANYVSNAVAARLKLLLKVFSLKKKNENENEKETVLEKSWQTMRHLEVAQKPELIRA